MNRSKKPILILLVLMVLAAAAAFLFFSMRVAPTVDHALRISELLQPVMDAENQTMHISVSTGISDETFTVESDVFLVSENGVRYLVVEQNGTAVYVADNVLFLENGKAFRIGDIMQLQAVSYEDLLPQIGTLYEMLEITAAETDSEKVYSVAVTGEQVASLLKAVSPGDSLPTSGIEKLNLRLTERDGNLEQISFSGNSELEGTSVVLNVSLSGFRILASGDYPIPETVKQSAAEVNPDELFNLTEDLYRLALALAPFADADTIGGTLKLTVDCGLLQLDSEMALSDLKSTANSQIDPEKLQALPEVLGWLCMEGDLTCSRNGDSYSYELALDQTSMKELSRMILPELAQYGGDLTEGSVSIILQDNAVASMYVSIKGKISVLFTQIPVTVGAEFIFE